MRRIIVNIILLIGFVVLIGAIVLPFVAEIEFAQAKELEVNYRWKKAGEKYQTAVHLNPLNAKYFAGAGDFMVRQSGYRKDKALWLGRAEKLYERACELNPQYAVNWYLLGKVEIASSLAMLAPRNDGVERAMECFRKAIERDPYNFRNNYLIGYNLLSVWEVLDDVERSFAKRRLKYVLQVKPYYGQYVYPAIIYYAEDFGLAQEVTPQTLAGHKKLYSFIVKNNLWQFRKDVAERLDFYQRKEEPEEFAKEREERERLLRSLRSLAMTTKESGSFAMTGELKDWVGKSRNGKNIYKNGNMYWTGTMDVVVEMPQDKAKIYITAKGSPANDVFPYMIVELDGEEIGETFVDSPEWKEHSFEVDSEEGLKVLSVTFANDGGNVEKSEDRNLYVGVVKVVRQ